MKHAMLLIACAAALAGCGERPQNLEPVKQDATVYSGTGLPYTQPGWKQGDKTSWEQQLRVRTQNGQNEYNKVP